MDDEPLTLKDLVKARQLVWFINALLSMIWLFSLSGPVSARLVGVIFFYTLLSMVLGSEDLHDKD